MKQRTVSPSAEKLTEEGYQIVPIANSKVSCQAPLSWCNHCDLCEHGSHFELKEKVTDKSRRMELQKNTRKATCCLFLVMCCFLLLTDYFRPYFGTAGTAFLGVLLLIFCVVGIFYSAKGILLTNNL